MKKALLLIGLVATLSQAAQRKLLIEESTDADCGPCPSGAVHLDSLEHAFPGRVIPVAFHYGDAMSNNTTHYSWMAYWRSGYPNFTLDRTNKALGLTDFNPNRSLYLSAMKDSVNKRLAKNSPVALTITNSYDPSTRIVSGKVIATFDSAYTGTNMRLGLMILQDTVQGVNTGRAIYSSSTLQVEELDGIYGYAQHNYLADSLYVNASWVNGVLQPGAQVIYFKPSVDTSANDRGLIHMTPPIVNWKHRHVVRASLLGSKDSVWGASGIIPNSVTKGATYQANFTYTLPAKYYSYDLPTQTFSSTLGVVAQPTQMKLVAFVAADAQKNILNAEESDLNITGSTTAVRDQDFHASLNSVFKAKSEGQLQVLSVQGKILWDRSVASGEIIQLRELGSGSFIIRYLPKSSAAEKLLIHLN